MEVVKVNDEKQEYEDIKIPLQTLLITDGSINTITDNNKGVEEIQLLSQAMVIRENPSNAITKKTAGRPKGSYKFRGDDIGKYANGSTMRKRIAQEINTPSIHVEKKLLLENRKTSNRMEVETEENRIVLSPEDLETVKGIECEKSEAAEDCDWNQAANPMINRKNMCPDWDVNTKLVDIEWNDLPALTAIGKPIDYIPSGIVNIVQSTFIAVFENYLGSPDDEQAAKKLILLPSVLFNDPGTKRRQNLVSKCKLILNDEWDEFTIGTFSGRYITKK